MQVLLLEDDAEARQLVRDAVHSLEAHVISLCEVDTVAQCRQRLEADHFDLLLVDLVLPDGSGMDAIRFAGTLPEPPTVLVISSVADEDSVIEAIMAGAQGYVSKLDPPEEISRSVAVAAAGGSCISPMIAQRLIEVMRRQSAAPTQPVPHPVSHQVRLTDSELRVLQLAARGCSYRQIAEITRTRASTVYTHVRHVYEKLHVSNLAQALYEARRLQLV